MTWRKFLRRAAIVGVCVIIAGLILVRAQGVLAFNAVTPVFTTQLGGGNAGYVRHSSPTLADINGDGKLEIIVGTLKSCGAACGEPDVSSSPYLSVLKSDGSVLWERQVEGHINSSPAVGDINGDTYPEIVVGLGAENEPQMPGGVVAYDRNGNRLWKVTTGDRDSNGLADGVFASPSIADVNNDGIPEVIFGAWDMRMYVVKGTDGTPLRGSGTTPYNYWPAEMLDTTWSSPAIADLNGDGKYEFAWGGAISYNPAAGTSNGGLLRVFDHDSVNGPTPFPGFNTLYGNTCTGGPCSTDIGHYGKYVDQSLDSSPAIGDINNDGKLEIVIGSGRAFSPGSLGHWVKVFDSQGNLLRTLTTDGVVFGSPALADINGDGYLDIIVGTERLDQGINPPPGTLYAWSGKDFSLLWSLAPKIYNGQNLLITSSPVVADIDPTSSGPEILFGLGPEICVVSASGQQLTADNLNSTKPTLWMGLSPVVNSPAVADIDNDGNLEIVAAGSYNPMGQAYNYHGWVVAYRWPGAQGNASGASLPWPMFRRDAVHSARVGVAVPYLSVSPQSISVMHQVEDPSNERATLQIHNTGVGSFNWSAAAPTGVTLSPSSGTISTFVNTTVTISTAGRPVGVYNLSNIIITATSGGNPVAGSPVSIPVTLNIVSQIYRGFTPLIQK